MINGHNTDQQARIDIQILVNGIAPVVVTDEMKQAAFTWMLNELKKPDILLHVFIQNIAGILYHMKFGPPKLMEIAKRSQDVKAHYEGDKDFRSGVNAVAQRLHFVTVATMEGRDPT